MYDTNEGTSVTSLTHDRPCPGCGHAVHSYLPCSDTCSCVPTPAPGGEDLPLLVSV